MKLFVRLAILVATFLLMTNMALAITCDQEACYYTTSTFSNSTTSSDTFWVCLNNDGTGGMIPAGVGPAPLIPLIVFGGSPFGAGFDLVPGWSTWIINEPTLPLRGFFWTQADGSYLNGEGYKSGERFILKGTKVPCLAP